MKLDLSRALTAGTLTGVLALSGCAAYGPPSRPAAPASRSAPGRRGITRPSRPASQPVAPLQPTPVPPTAAPPRHFQLSAPAAALVSIAQSQERGGHYGLAMQTLERALSIEPRNPLVWLALGRESLSAGSPAQAYGMARKALYLAGGAAPVQASAWGLIAASLRAQGKTQAAVAAENRAAQLYSH